MEIGVSDILSYTFEVSQSDTYKAVKVKWRSPSAKRRIRRPDTTSICRK